MVTTACAAPTPDDPPESCTGTLTLLGADGARRAQAELFEAPGHVLECEDLAVVLALDVLDLDGDDRDEAVIRWEETGEPQPAVGSQRTEHVAIVALPTLAWLWEEQVGAHGAGGQDSCEYTLVARPAGCTGRRELAFERDCMTAVCRPEDDEDDPDGDGIADAWCPEKEPPVVTRGVYRANPTTRRFEAR
ncbi:MAG: hypothetical protein CVU56_26085 [Deltaproteobacteria bacterium HGW-Deltaproteobacteria-14]|nr:MAG: hypothetical protein CVU56_26085 [Deltaproteobacteria bacterium HGW-Deltaproteobacteria-14]